MVRFLWDHLSARKGGGPSPLPTDPYLPGGARVEPSGPISFGDVPLRAGRNELVVELIGKDARSAGYGDGYLVGIDGLLLLE